MSPFDHTDASLASSAPFLAVAEPAFLLLPFALWALARPIGNAHTLHSHRLRSCFVSAGIERGIRRHQPRNAPELILMSCDGRDQQLGIMGPPGVDFIFGDDLVLRFLQLHRFTILPNSLGLPALPLRMTSVDGSNTLTILPSKRVSPRKTRALVCCITRRARGTIRSSCARKPSSVLTHSFASHGKVGQGLF